LDAFVKAQEQISLIADYKQIFESEAGQNVLKDLLVKGHFFHTSYTGNSNDTIFREGERNIVNMILIQLQKSPADMLKHLEKQRKKGEEDEW
jgi:hypothetical protein